MARQRRQGRNTAAPADSSPTPAGAVLRLDWHGCYEAGWGELIVPDAFAHPAKFSYGLIARIIQHGLDRGWWKPGDLLADPFAGVACGGIVAAYRGLRWLGVELEPRFVDLAHQNFALHAARWRNAGDPEPQIVQGDSRRFAEIVGRCGAVCTSPPYADTGLRNEAPQKMARLQQLVAEGKITGRESVRVAKKGAFNPNTQVGTQDDYGRTPGQIGRLPAGSVDGVVTSPPFSEDQPCASQSRAKKDYHAFTRGDGTKRDHQMADPANLANLPAGVAGVVTSPPWENQEPSHAQGDEHFAVEFQKTGGRDFLAAEYGGSDGQIGNDAGETYWEACAQVYAQCRLALRPGGMLVVVVKNYVKDKAIVPLCDQTWALLQRIGFQPVERIRAMLVKETRQPDLFGGEHVRRKERKSFFRRLAESKGSPRIDWEEVLCVRSPCRRSG